MLLGIGTNKERRNVNDLLSDADVSLSDENTSVVDGLCKALLENLGLESALHQPLGGELKNIIERVLFVGHEAESLQAADEGRGLEKALRILIVEG